jgi:hypothetical protein
MIAGRWWPGLLVLLLSLLPAAAAAQTPTAAEGLARLAEALGREGTYVDPRLRGAVPVGEEARLQQKIDTAAVRGVILRLALVDQLPAPYTSLDAFADALMAALGLRDGVLVVATPRAVVARSDRVPSDQVEQLAAAGREVLQREGYVAGLEAATEAVVGAAATTITPEPLPTLSGPTNGGASRVLERRPGGLPTAALTGGLIVLLAAPDQQPK